MPPEECPSPLLATASIGSCRWRCALPPAMVLAAGDRLAPMEYCHIGTATGLAPAPSAPGLGSPLPHLLRDWAHPITSAPGLRLPAVLGPRIAWLLSTLPRFATSAYVSARPPIDRRWCVESAFCVVPFRSMISTLIATISTLQVYDHHPYCDYQYPYCDYQYPYCDYQYPYCDYQYPFCDYQCPYWF